MMKLSEQAYGGKIFRPKSEVFQTGDQTLIIVACAWGRPEGATRTIEVMQEYLEAASNDVEVTAPFDFIPQLSSAGNALRIASLLANDQVFREQNADEYTTGVELFAVQRTASQLDWVQVGGPQILLSRQGRPLTQIGGQTDLSFDMSPANLLLPPLPSALLGIETSVYPSVGSLRIAEKDRLLLSHRSFLPQELYVLDKQGLHLEGVTRLLADQHPELPFWLGLVEFT